MATVTQNAPTIKARYAVFHGLEGMAFRLANQQCVFVDHSSQGVVLASTDIPNLVLLGSVDLIEEQNLLDALQGGRIAICTQRAQEVA